MCILLKVIFITNFMTFASYVGHRDPIPIYDFFSPFEEANAMQDEELLDVVPWIGLLRVRQENKPDSVTHVVLVANNMAIGNALEVSKLNFNSWQSKTKVIFVNKKGLLWGCDVENYIIHDEIYKSQNTMAIIKLNNKFKYPWNPVRWSVLPYEPTESIYLIRFSDEGRRLKQIITKMKSYPRTSCDIFYKREGLAIESLMPQNYHCFTSTEDRGHCVYEAGMAIATNVSGEWTLLGISTLGPGCSLPSRFIDFYPYYKWLIENTYIQTRKYIKAMADKSRLGYIPQEFIDDRDKYALNFLNDDKVVMKLENELKEGVNALDGGDCNPKHKLVYKDQGYIRVKPKQTSTAVYSLSLHDLHLNKITCVRISILCSKKSKTKIFFRKGYEQDELEQLIRTIPFVKKGQTVPPKVLFIKDDYRRLRGYQTANIWFKFEFVKQADIKVEFFGVHQDPTTSTEGPTTTPETDSDSEATTTRRTRPPRVYETHLANGR